MCSRRLPKLSHPAKHLIHCWWGINYEKQVWGLREKKELDCEREEGVIPVSGLMFCGCVVGAGLLREWAWTGVPEIGCWAAADWSCESRGSCQVVVFSRWLQKHNKSKHICACYIAATSRARSASDLLYLYNQTCTHTYTHADKCHYLCYRVAFDRSVCCQAMCSHEWNWLKPHWLQN